MCLHGIHTYQLPYNLLGRMKTIHMRIMRWPVADEKKQTIALKAHRVYSGAGLYPEDIVG